MVTKMTARALPARRKMPCGIAQAGAPGFLATGMVGVPAKCVRCIKNATLDWLRYAERPEGETKEEVLWKHPPSRVSAYDSVKRLSRCGIGAIW